MYHDGIHKGTQNLNKDRNRAAGSGNVVIGSTTTALSPWSTWSADSSEVTTTPPIIYGTMTVDEVIMWNKALTSNEVTQVYATVPE